MTSNVKSLVYKMNIVVDCKDAGVLAEFYSKLLGVSVTRINDHWLGGYHFSSPVW